ncbi:hypothetical protein ACFV27_11490 [Streptomyces antimycoticus]|uniref:hypothetical protein n=1 Tax=Streptomyces antimycoticus TaxID=68175 RepID=UPI0025705E34|nr:hypothetical protein [Streptomyces antimycoticus]WJD97214.1 hypothetical protein QR300_15150 [Streptomyces antimycoticus]WTB05518.1 hypothetical protein OG546_15615 [Streptomyces antimycoticus]
MGTGGGGKVLDIKVADIKSVAPTFHHQSVKLSEALTKLITTLDGYGEPWGDDKPGKDFGKQYKPNQTTSGTTPTTPSAAAYPNNAWPRTARSRNR